MMMTYCYVHDCDQMCKIQQGTSQLIKRHHSIFAYLVVNNSIHSTLHYFPQKHFRIKLSEPIQTNQPIGIDWNPSEEQTHTEKNNCCIKRPKEEPKNDCKKK